VKLRSWPILAVAFGTLLLLIVLGTVENWRQTSQIYSAILAIHQSHARAEAALRGIETGIYRSSVFTRDFLLDPSHLTVDVYRDELRSTRTAMEQHLAALHELTGAVDPALLARLRGEVDAYWDSMEPLFDWTPQQKIALSSLFLRRQVLPRRKAVMEIARQVEGLNAADLLVRQQQMDRKLAAFRRSGQVLMAASLTLGALVSVASILRISRLENRAERQHIRTERAERELRRLSQQLVRAQEDERRSLSRELHDEMGQTLTALRVELGNLEKLRAGPTEVFHAHMEDAKRLASETLASARNLAAGLRPSVLDDLGLGPALEWQAREFSRRTGVPVEVQVEGLPPELPESHRTCVYRVAQEALTNCARHARAGRIRILLYTDAERLSLAVEDDGRGFAPDAPRQPGGLGLIGIEERVAELGGTLAIHSQPGKGTLLKISLPLPAEAA